MDKNHVAAADLVKRHRLDEGEDDVVEVRQSGLIEGIATALGGRQPEHALIGVAPSVILDLKRTSGELRHLYEILFGQQSDVMKELADGLLSPQIKRLERLVATLEGSGPARPKPDDA